MKKIYILLLVYVGHIVNANTKPVTGFIENKGQIHDQNFSPNTTLKYLLSIPGMNIQLKQNSFSYDTYATEQKNKEVNRETALPNLKRPKADFTYHFHRVDVEFIGANTQPEIIAEEPSETYFNYYTTGTSEQGAINVRSYEKVTYKNIYPNIDLEFIAKDGKMKYNFILHYGADINMIKWKYHGANTTEIKNNNISIAVKQGALNETIPESYITANSQKVKQVKINFTKNENSIYGFNCNQKLNITSGQDLVIDPTPTVVWSTYFGGNPDDYFGSTCTDSKGNVYITGWTKGASGLATSGAFQTIYGGGAYDIIIVKFNSTGALKWATYYGKNGSDMGNWITLDKYFGLYVTGVTNSTSMATTGSHQTTIGGGYDGFLAKFDTNGVRQWSTYYGGSNYDDIYSCSADKSGDIYVAGNTASTISISTIGSHQPTYGGGPYDGYLAKFNANGVRQWATYYGGSGDDGLGSCVNDATGNTYIAGYANSPGSISTAGSHQIGYSGYNDAMVVKFNSNGIRQWGTYYGGYQLDVFQTAHFDTLGYGLYLTGFSRSSDSISSTGSHQSIYSGSDDAIFVKFDTNGVRQWGTYYGGTSFERGLGITSNSTGVYLSGLTDSFSSISTSGSYQGTYGQGSGDAFLAKFDTAGVIQWGTYYGGSSYEIGAAVVSDINNDIYMVGMIGSPGFATSGAYQVISGGSYDGFCTKFSEAIAMNISESQLPNYFTIFPNPNSGSFTIQTKEDVVLEIVNELGQLVKTIKLDNSNNHQTSITNLADGVYCLKDKLSGSVIRNKIVVVR